MSSEQKGTVFLAHGAGAGMDSDFMGEVGRLLESIGLKVIAFNFPYMERIKQEGKRRPPDPMPKLMDAFRAVVQAHIKEGESFWLAGKSMGGRVASLLADELKPQGVFVFGYPFHPQGKPDTLRTEHLLEIETPIDIFQGTRDKLGAKEEVLTYNLPPQVRLHWCEDGDHDLKPRVRSGFTQQQHLQSVINVIKGVI